MPDRQPTPDISRSPDSGASRSPQNNMRRKLAGISLAITTAVAGLGIGWKANDFFNPDSRPAETPTPSSPGPTPEPGRTLTPYPSSSQEGTQGATNSPGGSSSTESPAATDSTAPTESAETNAQDIMKIGDEEKWYIQELIGYLTYAPDGQISYWTTANGQRRYLITGGLDNGTYSVLTDGSKTLDSIFGSGNVNADTFTKVFGRVFDPNDANAKIESKDEWRKYYAGITTFWQLDQSNPDHVWGLVHGEDRNKDGNPKHDKDASGSYTATIGLVESTDGGASWIDHGALIHGTDIKKPGGTRVSGAGQPTSIYNPKDGYLYIMYIDWSATLKDPNVPDVYLHKDQIYMARSKPNSDGSLGPIEYYTTNGFQTTTNVDIMKPVIPVPDVEGNSLIPPESPSPTPEASSSQGPTQSPSDNWSAWKSEDMKYTALPSVAWSTTLNKFICTGESDTGFWVATSDDLINWTKPDLIYSFRKMYNVTDPADPNPGPPLVGLPHSVLKPGGKWDSYPTPLDETQADSKIIGSHGILYHSTGNNLNGHEPATLSWTLNP